MFCKKYVGLSLFLACAGFASLTGCGTDKVKLADSFNLTFEGYNGYGTASVEDDYSWVEDVIENYGKDLSGEKQFELESELYDAVDYTISPEDGISNGDEVTITIEVDNTNLKEYGLKLVGGDKKIKVSGLDEVEEIDPFESLSVTYEGIAPNAYLRLDTSGTGVDGIEFTADKEENLSNGDTITITASSPFYSDEEYVQNYGKVLSETKKEYVVSGLSSYVSKIDEIPSDMQEKMLNQASDAISADSAKWEDGNTLKQSEFLGYYFLTTKEGVSSSPNNEIYCVYKNTATLTGLKRGGDGETQETGELVYYTYYRYSDLMLLEDGTCSLDISAGELCNNYIETDYGYYDLIACFYTLKGYSDLDSMFNDCVTKNIESYSYESSVG